MTIFNPIGSLNVSADAGDIKDGDFVRCKNLRIDQQGFVKTRDGSTKLNAAAIDTSVWHIEEQAGDRYVFAGESIYKNESSIASGLTSAQWSGIQYNAFNDTEKNIFALNGTDRKRIEDGVVYEWGLAAPTTAPTIDAGAGSGLTGEYNVKYTYVRKVGTAIVAESNPSDAATDSAVLDNESLAVSITQSSDTQVTHIRLYRTLDGGEIYYLDTEIEANITITHGYSEGFEKTFAYISGTGYKFTKEDDTNSTENTYTWEELFADREDQESSETPTYGDGQSQIPWWKLENNDPESF